MILDMQHQNTILYITPTKIFKKNYKELNFQWF